MIILQFLLILYSRKSLYYFRILIKVIIIPIIQFILEIIFSDINLLIDKTKFYVNNILIIDGELKNNYDSIFFIKSNIINKTIEIINNNLKMKTI